MYLMSPPPYVPTPTQPGLGVQLTHPYKSICVGFTEELRGQAEPHPIGHSKTLKNLTRPGSFSLYPVPFCHAKAYAPFPGSESANFWSSVIPGNPPWPEGSLGTTFVIRICHLGVSPVPLCRTPPGSATHGVSRDHSSGSGPWHCVMAALVICTPHPKFLLQSHSALSVNEIPENLIVLL